MCPRCKVRNKYMGDGYCRPCRREYNRTRKQAQRDNFKLKAQMVQEESFKNQITTTPAPAHIDDEIPLYVLPHLRDKPPHLWNLPGESDSDRMDRIYGDPDS